MNEIIDGMVDVTSFEQLTAESVNRLARFNAEESRGLVHTEEYCKQMAKLQARFDRSQQSLLPDSHGMRRKYWWQR